MGDRRFIPMEAAFCLISGTKTQLWRPAPNSKFEDVNGRLFPRPAQRRSASGPIAGK
jgi:hypothetical protein